MAAVAVAAVGVAVAVVVEVIAVAVAAAASTRTNLMTLRTICSLALDPSFEVFGLKALTKPKEPLAPLRLRNPASASSCSWKPHLRTLRDAA